MAPYWGPRLVVLWRFARSEIDVDAVARRLSRQCRASRTSGDPDAAIDDSVVYGTAPDGSKLELDVWPDAAPAATARGRRFVRLHGGGLCSRQPRRHAGLEPLVQPTGLCRLRHRIPGAAAGPLARRDRRRQMRARLDRRPCRGVRHRSGEDRRHRLFRRRQSGDAGCLQHGRPALAAFLRRAAGAGPLVVNLYGPTDLAAATTTARSRGLRPGRSTPVYRRQPGGISRAPSPPPRRSAYVGPDAPPTISFLGASDRIIPTDQARILDEALEPGRGAAATPICCRPPTTASTSIGAASRHSSPAPRSSNSSSDTIDDARSGIRRRWNAARKDASFRQPSEGGGDGAAIQIDVG